MSSLEQLAKLLRTDIETLERFAGALALASSKPGVIDSVVKQNHDSMRGHLTELGVKPEGPSSHTVQEALSAKLKTDDSRMQKILGNPRYLEAKSYDPIFDLARDTSGVGKGFFLKKEKAIEFLRQQPPRVIIQSLGYTGIDELLQKEDVWEVYSALRFLENRDWLNKTFFAQYETLTPADFEERAIATRFLSDKWKEPAQYYLRHKYFNVSNLKELGLIFVIPWTLDAPGETMRLVGLLSHYYHEINFYASLFRDFAAQHDKFAQRVISALRGDTASRVPEGDFWLIITRYLARDDESDWRLAYPHLNPESIHWSKAQSDIAKIGEKFNEPELTFWNDLDWVGDYFKNPKEGKEQFLSFNLMDVTMSVLKESEGLGFTYHHREALWNKLFSDYFDSKTLRSYIEQHITEGYFKV